MTEFPELVVHIGAGKTGSTSIQFMLKRNEKPLLEQKTAYFGLTLEHIPQARVFSWCEDKAPQSFFRAPDKQKVEAEAVQVVLAELERLGKLGIRQAIWSNEAFLTRSDRVLGIFKALKDAGVRMRFICYVRRHDKWARSGYVQFGIKFKTYKGPVRTFSEWAAHQDIGFSDDIAKWTDAFPGAIELYNFDVVSDVAQHFLSLIGLSGISTVHANSSPSDALLAMWAVHNSCYEETVLPHRFSQIARETGILHPSPATATPPIDELLPTVDDLRSIQDSYKDDFDQVNELLVSRGEPPLVFDELAPSEPDAAPWSIEKLLTLMICSQQEQIWQLKQEIADLKASRED